MKKIIIIFLSLLMLHHSVDPDRMPTGSRIGKSNDPNCSQPPPDASI